MEVLKKHKLTGKSGEVDAFIDRLLLTEKMPKMSVGMSERGSQTTEVMGQSEMMALIDELTK